MSYSRREVITVVVLITSAFLAGRFAAPTKIKIEKVKESSVVENKSQDKSESVKIDKDKAIETSTIEIIKPDGTRIKRNKTKEVTSTSKDKQKDVSTTTEKSTQIKETESKLVENNHDSVSLSLLAGKRLNDWSSMPIYGVHLQKRMIGPFTLGFFGFQDTTVGASVGIQF